MKFLIDTFHSLNALLPCPKKVIFAISPLLVLGYVLFSAFENEDAERRKRSKKNDFELEGHSE